MSGTFTPLGAVTVGAMVPGIMPIYSGIVAGLQTRLAAAIELVAQLNATPPSLAANLVKALQLVAALQAAIAIGAPSIDFKLAMAAKLVAEIRAELALLLGLPFGTAGAYAYKYGGDAASIPSAAAAEFSGGLPGGSPGDHVDGVFYVTSVGAAWTAMGAVLKVA